jgi:hypothetical protein
MNFSTKSPGTGKACQGTSPSPACWYLRPFSIWFLWQEAWSRIPTNFTRLWQEAWRSTLSFKRRSPNWLQSWSNSLKEKLDTASVAKSVTSQRLAPRRLLFLWSQQMRTEEPLPVTPIIIFHSGAEDPLFLPLPEVSQSPAALQPLPGPWCSWRQALTWDWKRPDYLDLDPTKLTFYH